MTLYEELYIGLVYVVSSILGIIGGSEIVYGSFNAPATMQNVLVLPLAIGVGFVLSILWIILLLVLGDVLRNLASRGDIDG